MSSWWQRGSLASDARGLTFAGQPLAELARTQGTPLYVYDCGVVGKQVTSLRRALATVGRSWRIYYALKANRHPAVVTRVRSEGDVGIDACSPREVELALAHGFSASEISVTSSMPSNSDLAAFATAGTHVNLDSCSAVRRFAELVPRGTAIGLRVDPGIRVGYDDAPKVSYGDSKLGIDKSQISEALDLARDVGLLVDTLHMHLGWGLQRDAVQAFEQALSLLVGLATRCPHLRAINVGGGLGARRRARDAPLPLDDWAAALGRQLGGLDTTVACEPGTLLVDWAGVLLTQVTTVERKADRLWLGVDAGHNLNVYAAHYGLPIGILPTIHPDAPSTHTYSVAGNLNESGDVFSRDIQLPEVREGDFLAFVPGGAYGASMASEHCLRGPAREVAL